MGYQFFIFKNNDIITDEILNLLSEPRMKELSIKEIDLTNNINISEEAIGKFLKSENVSNLVEINMMGTKLNDEVINFIIDS